MTDHPPTGSNGSGKSPFSLPQAALVVMLVSIMLPPVNYAIRQKEATPTQLITSICISLFASVLFLWILDATGIAKFRSAWISRSVYSVAVFSVLAATVGIYKDGFATHLHPLDGIWSMSAWTGDNERVADNLEVILYFKQSRDGYSGYSAYVASGQDQEDRINHFRIERLSPEDGIVFATAYRGTRSVPVHSDGLKLSRNKASFEFISGTAGTLGATRYVFSRP